jgi:hypothetical protein
LSIPADKPAVRKRYYTRLMDIYRHKTIYIPFVPALIRTLLAAKARYQVARMNRIRGTLDSDIKQWLSQHRLFFGFALFRSGTTFLANFLNTAAAGAIVQQEADVNDYYYYCSAIQDESGADQYISEYRIAEMYLRLHKYQFDTYGEINPFLRRHCRALKSLVPFAKFFHLVRDGRMVVRSLMSRELFAIHDPMAKLIYPPRKDPYRERWKTMSRFEKLCWVWQADNRYIREHVEHSVRLELLVSDYDYFAEKILHHLNFDIDRRTWARYCQKVENRTRRYRMPSFNDWSNEERKAFQEICADEMLACGYSL